MSTPRMSTPKHHVSTSQNVTSQNVNYCFNLFTVYTTVKPLQRRALPPLPRAESGSGAENVCVQQLQARARARARAILQLAIGHLVGLQTIVIVTCIPVIKVV